jgi:hypothetical protein
MERSEIVHLITTTARNLFSSGYQRIQRTVIIMIYRLTFIICIDVYTDCGTMSESVFYLFLLKIVLS